MRRLFVLVALTGLALPASAQDAPQRVVVAEVVNEAIQPLLSPPQIFGLVGDKLAAARSAEGGDQPPRFEQFWIARGSTFQLTVDAQFPDGNDFLMSLPLEEVAYQDKTLLVLDRAED
ncbi:MAG: hypothetical protein Rubg2KO_35950 [Rubricoccaceae bacterium]